MTTNKRGIKLWCTPEQDERINRLAEICKRRGLVEQYHLRTANANGAIHQAVAEYLKQLEAEEVK